MMLHHKKSETLQNIISSEFVNVKTASYKISINSYCFGFIFAFIPSNEGH